MEYFDVPTITYLPIRTSNSLHRGLGIHLLKPGGVAQLHAAYTL